MNYPSLSTDPRHQTRARRIANKSHFGELDHEFFKFARWAFSPEGLPELRILAWGDFSHNGRWRDSNILLCRDWSDQSGSYFRTLKNSDFDYWELIDENMDMLSACPSDQLLWNPHGY
jgi:hypothetical protein